MHSSRSLRRPSLFALSLSITLSFSPSISSLSFPLLPTFLVSSSCISLPLSPSFFLFQRSCICSSPPPAHSLFLSLSRSLFPPPSNPPSSSNQRCGQPLATCIPSFLLSSFHPLSLSLSVSSHSVSLSPGWSTLFFHPSAPGWPIVPSLSLSPPRILFRRCLYIATGWYAGAYIIRGHV